MNTERDPSDAGCFRFSVTPLLLAVMGLSVIFAVAVPAIRTARRLSHQTTCHANLKSIGLAIQNYHDVHRAYPWPITYTPDGRPMNSWRVAILPYMMQQSFYDRYKSHNEPWNGPRNKLLADDVPDTWETKDGQKYKKLFDAEYFMYRCPSAPRSQSRMCTNYVMLIDDRPGKSKAPPDRLGSVPLAKLGDSHVVIIEIADSDIIWVEPRDVLLSELSMRMNDRSRRSVSSYHGSACVLRADGTVNILDEKTTREQLQQMLVPGESDP